MLASYMGWKYLKFELSNEKEEKFKQKRGGSGVGDTIKMNVGSVNKNWI